MKQPKLQWMVFYYSMSSRSLTTINIFKHSSFYESVCKNYKKYKNNKDEFAKAVKSDLMYYFWCKAEYEIIISPFCGGNNEELKIDVYTQIMNNWDIFVNYVWTTLENARKEGRKQAKEAKNNNEKE